MNDKKIPTDKQEELILRAEPFLSGDKTPTANADELYTLLGDFEECFNGLDISEEWSSLEKIWNKLRLLDEIYTSISLYHPIPGYKANIRDRDNRVLGVVTDRYKVVQNAP